MINFTTYLDRKRWRLEVYILEQCNEGNDIIEALASAGCRGADLADAAQDLRRCGKNIGIAYSIKSRRNSMIVIGMQDDKSEFVNTMRHEQHHIIAHICETDDVDMHDEEAAYIAGEVGQALYDEMTREGII